ncbi:MAG: alpha/beta fold hydrolase [Aggregatilineales bacterium]
MNFARFMLLAMCLLLFTVGLMAQENFAADNGEFMTINNETLYFESLGDENDPVVMLIHGFGGSTVSWRFTMQPLADAGFYVIALDMPPFGLSDKRAEIDYTRSAMADRIAHLMDALDIETATIAGHSMGGSVTAYFAVNYPERVDKLVFISGGIFDLASVGEHADPDELTPNGLLDVLATLDPNSPLTTMLANTVVTESVFRDLIESAYYDNDAVTDEVVALYYRPLQLDNWVQGFIAYTTAQEDNPLTVEMLADAVDNVPVMIIWGEDDTWVDITVGEGMNSAFEAEFVAYPEIGHLVMEELPDAFNTDLIAFLQE